MAICTEAAARYGNHFSYTLLESKDVFPVHAELEEIAIAAKPKKKPIKKK